MDSINRDNDTWLAHLLSEGSIQQEALSDLRDILCRNLRRAISRRANVDESFLEDVVQDTLVLILDRLQQFKGRSRFVTWATSIAIRVAMSNLRRQRWKDISLDALIDGTEFILDGIGENKPGLEIQFEQKAILSKMYAVIQNELTDKQRTALLAELKGMPMEEIARRLGSNRNAVYKLTHDARMRLKQGLETAGYAAADVTAAFTI